MRTPLLPLFVCALLAGGCASFRQDTGVPSVPCTYRFKMLSRPEDQSRVEQAIRSVALGGVVAKSGTVTFPEYRFRVARMADLDRLHPQLIFLNPGSPIASRRQQALNVRGAGVEVSFDSTDLSAQATTTVSFAVKPGSRLYYKDQNGNEQDITSRVGKNGTVSFPIQLKEGQRYVYARAVKDRVNRYIRVNIFTNQLQDISRNEYQ
ncbi:MAG: hypothetical protein J6334_10185 [Kiritimatiellae bacterium]|nr:hypothetical protein [Kiritimatiellia bacterium]